MKKIASIIFAMAFTTASLRADLQVRAAQQQLKEEGFYYGEVDGKPGAETGAAIRRYQIRNGLQVTGSLNQETLDALKIGGNISAATTPKPTPTPRANPPKPKPTPFPSANENDRDYLRQSPDEGGAQAPIRPQNVLPPPVVITSQASVLSSQYAALFSRTPYENAPAEVQQRTLRNAQLLLLRERFYNGQIDGIPGPATARAITFYQDATDLPRTGRLDYETLAEMRLLPTRHAAPIQPFFPSSEYHREADPPRIYRGIWIR